MRRVRAQSKIHPNDWKVPAYFEGYLRIAEAADFVGKTYEAVAVAMRRGKLEYIIRNGVKYTSIEWLKRFELEKWDRFNLTLDGKRVFDAGLGKYNVNVAAHMLGITIDKLYHMIENGEVKTERAPDGFHHIIYAEEICATMAILRERETGYKSTMLPIPQYA